MGHSGTVMTASLSEMMVVGPRASRPLQSSMDRLERLADLSLMSLHHEGHRGGRQPSWAWPGGLQGGIQIT